MNNYTTLELIDSIQNSNLLDSSEDEAEMNDTSRNNAPIYQLLKLYVDTIPNYNGNPTTLEIFIFSCNYLFSAYGNFNDPLLNNYLIRVVIGKLIDQVQSLIATRSK